MALVSLRYLRISVTSRCNLACLFCRPGCGHGVAAAEAGEDVLSREEIVCFVRLAVACGIEKVRVTGGEPLVRSDIIEVIRDLASLPSLRDLSLTTNGTLLPRLARPLREAGLRRINIGLSAMDPEVYRRITRGGRAEDGPTGLRAAVDAGFDPIKVNVVVLRGINDGEIPALAGLTRDLPIEVRFIEFMPFGRSAEELDRYLVPADAVLARLRELGDLEPVPGARGAASAQRLRIRGYKGTIGLIAPHSEPFCHSCNRVRLTADGKLRACLIEGGEQDVLPLIRQGLDRPTMERLLAAAAAMKPTLHAGSFRGQMHRIGG
jgi:cyclic pyranopterin phosphate synthase